MKHYKKKKEKKKFITKIFSMIGISKYVIFVAEIEIQFDIR